MTQNRDLYHQHHHHHHHHYHYYNYQESIHVSPLVPDKINDPADPMCTIQIDNKSGDQINTSSPVKAPHTAMANCKREVDTEVPLQQNAKEYPKLHIEIGKFACLIGFLSLVILGPLLVSNYMALRILVIVEYSFFLIVSLMKYLHDKFCANYNGSWSSIYDAPENIKEDEKGFLSWFLINLAVINAALLIEKIWIIKLLSMFTPLCVLSCVLLFVSSQT